MDEFDQTTIEALQHYVYRLEDPRQPNAHRTFYVGKGQGNRAFQHARDALDRSTASDKLERIREIVRHGTQPIIFIHRHGMDEATALHVEAALIDAYGTTGDLTNEIRGQNSSQGMMTTDEVLELYQAIPLKADDPVILIKIEREWKSDLTEAQLYERTRRYWIANPDARRTRPKYALAIARGIVREVYEIERWERYPGAQTAPHDPTRIDRATDADVADRVGFIGRVAPDKATYRKKSVRGIQNVGAQNPIKYLNCG